MIISQTSLLKLSLKDGLQFSLPKNPFNHSDQFVNELQLLLNFLFKVGCVKFFTSAESLN